MYIDMVGEEIFDNKIISPSGRIYIGQTWDWSKREVSYKYNNCKSQIAIYNSLLKYGYSAHRVEILCNLSEDATQKELDDKEIFYYNLYKEQGIKLLNIREPGRGGKFSEESIEKRRKKLIGRKLSESHRRRITEVNRSEEQREIRRKKLKGHLMSEETKKRISYNIKKKWEEGKYLNRKERKDKRIIIRKDKYYINYRKVEVRDINGKLINIYDNYRECAKDLGIFPSTISTYISKHTISRNHTFNYI